MSATGEGLYALLPAVYRERDAARGFPLRALTALIAEQIVVMEEDLEQLYDDLFIETCADWVVPYLGALVGVSDAEASRAEVANTLAYRRRKGTTTVLEQLARDITGWPSSVVEYFQLLATTQYLNHLRPGNLALADLRRPRLSGTLFDGLPRTVEVRRISSGRGRYNVANIGIHSWRIAAFEVNGSPAHALDATRFRFDPLGRDTALFNRPLPEPDIDYRAAPWNVPMPLSRALLADHPERYFGSSLALEVGGEPVVPAADETWLDRFSVCNLMDFDGTWANLPQDRIAIDPELGRLAFPASAPPSGEVRLTWHHGFSAQIGGGAYPREEGFAAGAVIRVPEDGIGTLQAGIDAAVARVLDEDLPGASVEIADSGLYAEALQLNVPSGRWIELRAAESRRPVVIPGGDFLLGGGAGAEIRLDGLLVAGGALAVPESIGGDENQLQSLVIAHCTLAPGSSAFDPGPTPLLRLQVAIPCDVRMHRSISGALRLVPGVDLALTDCLVDAGGPEALALARDEVRPAGSVQISASTLIGRIHATDLSAENAILFGEGTTAPVRIERVQQGCVRFCWVGSGSILPRRYRCLSDGDEPGMRPVFTSLSWGEAGYAQLAARCPTAIRRGAEDGGEMGVFHHLRQTQKSDRLRRNLPEYLRLSLEAGVFFES